jgi:phosphoadenylyl-sulfate reductase (thioredoxin)
MTTLVKAPHEIDLARLSQWTSAELLRYVFETYGQRAAVGTSFQKTGVVIIDILSRLDLPYRVFTIDTGRCHDETYELMGEVEDRYGITIERFTPDPQAVEELNRTVGQFAHFLARPLCCKVRKQQPQQEALATLDAWVTGLRKDQSIHRREHATRLAWVEADHARPVLKINPLLNWSQRNIDEYTHQHHLPYNKLYDYVSDYGERYQVIGCKQCHIPVRDDLGPRAGKFPWEAGNKECGLHKDGGGI